MCVFGIVAAAATVFFSASLFRYFLYCLFHCQRCKSPTSLESPPKSSWCVIVFIVILWLIHFVCFSFSLSILKHSSFIIVFVINFFFLVLIPLPLPRFLLLLLLLFLLPLLAPSCYFQQLCRGFIMLAFFFCFFFFFYTQLFILPICCYYLISIRITGIGLRHFVRTNKKQFEKHRE